MSSSSGDRSSEVTLLPAPTGVDGAIADGKRVDYSLLDALPQLVFIADPFGRSIHQNSQWREYTGSALAADQSWLEAVHADQIETTQRRWRDSLADGQPYQAEVRLRRSDGAYRMHRLYLTPARDRGGVINHWIGTAIDIEDYRQAAERIRDAEQLRWRKLVDSKLFGVVITNEERVLDANQVYLDIIGYTAEELRDGKIRRINLTPPEYRPLDFRGVAELKETGSSMPYEKEYERRDGTRVPVLLGSTTLTEDPLSWIGFVVDLTEQKETQRALRESEQQLRALTDAAPLFLYKVLPNLKTGYLTQYFYDFTGQPRKRISLLPTDDGDLPLTSVLHPDDIAQIQTAWQEVTADRMHYGLECRIRRADGVYRWFVVRAVPEFDEQGKLACVYGGAVEIHAQKEAEAALLEADRRKDEFLAMLAHELRNPLAPIVNALEIIERVAPQSEPKLDRARSIIDRQVRHLSRIVDDLLDVTRITTGKIQLRTVPLAIATLIEHGVESARPLIDSSQHRLTVELADDSMMVNGDLVRLTQVLSNLLSNAAKYTPPGGDISVHVSRESQQTVIRVRDNGAGISPELLPHIFDLFTQADRTVNRAQGGLGIGLTVVQRLVELHGGRVDAFSRGMGHGSEFVVRLPLIEAPLQLDNQFGSRLRTIGEHRRRILVVDDNLDHLETLSQLLELENFEVFSASTGRDALEMMRTSCPSVVLLDLNLPDLDGCSVASSIRELPHGREVVIAAISGYGQATDLERSKAAGFDHHLVKPVEFERLLAICATSPRDG